MFSRRYSVIALGNALAIMRKRMVTTFFFHQAFTMLWSIRLSMGIRYQGYYPRVP